MPGVIRSEIREESVAGGVSLARVEPLVEVRFPALGTECLLLFPESAGRAGAEFSAEARGWLAAFEDRYSRFRPGSLISRINAAAGRDWVDLEPEDEVVLDLCTAMHHFSGGILDASALPLVRLWDWRAVPPRVPAAEEVLAARRLVGWHRVERRPGAVRLPEPGMGIDLGGWGKEYAVDQVAALGRQAGLDALLVDIGHDLYAAGAPPGRPAWHVGIEDPADPGRVRGSLAIRDHGVACSGDYLRSFVSDGRRYGHIVDPRSGLPVSNGLVQVVVVAPGCLQAGALSTTAFVLGLGKGLALIEETPGCSGSLATCRARHETSGFSSHVVPA